MQQVHHDLARIAKALSDDNRLRILDSLREGEKCACELLTDLRISQPTLSHHMKILCDAGLVSCRRDSRWAYYSTNARAIAAVAEEQALVAELAASDPARKRMLMIDLYKRVIDGVAELGFPLSIHFEATYGVSAAAFETFAEMLAYWTPPGSAGNWTPPGPGSS